MASWREPAAEIVFACTGADTHAPPVLLLHGMGCNPRTVSLLAKFLHRRLERSVLALHLGLGLGDLRPTAELLHTRLDRRMRGFPDEIDVVGHSLGGIVGSYLLKQLDRGRRVRRLVTLGSPHRGIGTDWLVARLLRGIELAPMQLRHGSRLLRALADEPWPRSSRVVSIAGGDDRLVPPSAAELAPAVNVSNLVVPGVNHFGLVLSRRVFAHVASSLADA